MHDHEQQRIIHLLLHIEDKVDRVLFALSQQKEFLVALADDLKAAIAKVDAETTDVGTLVASLASRIKNSMTDQEVADIKAAFTAVSDRLTTLAVDPTNPVPPPTPALSKARTLGGRP